MVFITVLCVQIVILSFCLYVLRIHLDYLFVFYSLLNNILTDNYCYGCRCANSRCILIVWILECSWVPYVIAISIMHMACV